MSFFPFTPEDGHKPTKREKQAYDTGLARGAMATYFALVCTAPEDKLETLIDETVHAIFRVLKEHTKKSP